MTLSTLIEKGGLTKLATMTAATAATQETEQAISVAAVATVAVAKEPKYLSALSPDEETKILSWLSWIGETKPTIIAGVLNKARDNFGIRQYLLRRSEEIPQSRQPQKFVTCGKCIHFDRTDHPHLGHCAAGRPEPIAGLWDADLLCCEFFVSQMKVPNSTNPIIWTS